MGRYSYTLRKVGAPMSNKEIILRAKNDPVFRMQFLKELVRMAVANDPDLISKVIFKIENKPKRKRK